MKQEKDKIKVLHVLGSMNMGGIQTFLMNIFRKIDREKYAFDFACMNSKNLFQDEIEGLGGNLYCIGRYRKILNHRKCLYELLKKNEYDYVHIHSGNAICVIDAILVKLYNRKQNVIYHSHNASAKMKKIHAFCKTLIPYFSDLRFACSKEAAQWMFPKKIIKQKKYAVISNGIDVEKFLYSKEAAEKIRRELGLQDEFVVGHVGRIDTQKNHKFLIEIFAQIVEKRPDSKLLLIGTGPLEDEVKTQVKDSNLQDKVIFLGLRKDVNKILCACDVFCLPSLFEGLGIVNIEAQACGLPCYISDVISDEVVVTELIKKESLNAPAEVWADRMCNEKTGNRESYNSIVAQSKYALAYTIKQICTFYDGTVSEM